MFSAMSSNESSNQNRWRDFAARLDAIRERVEAELGEDDVAHIRRIRAISTSLEVAGRALIQVAPRSGRPAGSSGSPIAPTPGHACWRA
jgi:fatty acid desaturase